MKAFFLSALAFLAFASSAQAQQVVIQMGGQGTVSVSGSGMVVTFGGNRLYRSRIPMNAPGSVVVGSSVMTPSGSVGTIAGMNPAAQSVVVAIPYVGNSTYSIGAIAVVDGCNGVFCAGETIITPSGSSGTVTGLFGDGRVAVNIAYVGTSIYQAVSLGLSDACSGYICTGDTVISPSGSSGTAVGLYADGRVAVNVPYVGVSVYQSKELSVTRAICANVYIDRVGLCR